MVLRANKTPKPAQPPWGCPPAKKPMEHKRSAINNGVTKKYLYHIVQRFISLFFNGRNFHPDKITQTDFSKARAEQPVNHAVRFARRRDADNLAVAIRTPINITDTKLRLGLQLNRRQQPGWHVVALANLTADFARPHGLGHGDRPVRCFPAWITVKHISIAVGANPKHNPLAHLCIRFFGSSFFRNSNSALAAALNFLELRP